MTEIIESTIVHPGELTEFPANSNTHPSGNIAELAESRRQFSQYKNAVVWSPPEEMTITLASGETATLKPGIRYVLAGNGLHQASLKRRDAEIEVKDYSHLTYEQAVLLAEADNASALGSAIDPAQMKANLERARALYVDNERMAGMLERARRLAGVVEVDSQNGASDAPLADKAEALQKKWQCETGQVWEFESQTVPGRFHRLICGDCRNPDDMVRVCDGEEANGVFTSPPYAEQRKQQYGGVPVGEYVNWWEAVQGNVRERLAEDGSFFVNIKAHAKDQQRSLYVFDLVGAMVRKWKWLFVDEYCWRRTGIPQQVVNRFKNQFEPIYWFANNKGFKFRPKAVRHRSEKVPIALGPGAGDTNAAKRQGAMGAIQGNKILPGLAYPGNFLDFPVSDNVLGHPAVFPLPLPAFFIRAYSDPGDIWLDPFLGSGTIIVAAEREGRIGLGIEKLPKYCAVICERLEGEGLEPKLIT